MSSGVWLEGLPLIRFSPRASLIYCRRGLSEFRLRVRDGKLKSNVRPLLATRIVIIQQVSTTASRWRSDCSQTFVIFVCLITTSDWSVKDRRGIIPNAPLIADAEGCKWHLITHFWLSLSCDSKLLTFSDFSSCFPSRLEWLLGKKYILLQLRRSRALCLLILPLI